MRTMVLGQVNACNLGLLVLQSPLLGKLHITLDATHLHSPFFSDQSSHHKQRIALDLCIHPGIQHCRPAPKLQDRTAPLTLSCASVGAMHVNVSAFVWNVARPIRELVAHSCHQLAGLCGVVICWVLCSSHQWKHALSL
jgi:hypothetical protein